LPEDYYNIKIREADNKNQPLFFDNPKTNLIYEKTLCVILFQISCQILYKDIYYVWNKKIFKPKALNINNILIIC